MAETHGSSRIGGRGPSTDPTLERSDEAVPRFVRQRVHAGTELFWGLVVGVVLAAALVILAAQNTDRVTIELLGWDLVTPQIVVILTTLVVGVVLDELFGLVYRVRRGAPSATATSSSSSRSPRATSTDRSCRAGTWRWGRCSGIQRRRILGHLWWCCGPEPGRRSQQAYCPSSFC